MARVTDPLILSRVVGDVLWPFTRSVELRVAYSLKDVINGCEFKPSQVVHKPRVEIGGNDYRTFYTIVMVDPDAPTPSNPQWREFVHSNKEGSTISSILSGKACKLAYRLVTDIPGNTGANFGKEIMCYESPRPRSGIHRFIFILFQQLGRQTVYAPDCRHNFSTRTFAELHNLGSPVAAVYFNCQRESGSGGRRTYT